LQRLLARCVAASFVQVVLGFCNRVLVSQPFVCAHGSPFFLCFLEAEVLDGIAGCVHFSAELVGKTLEPCSLPAGGLGRCLSTPALFAQVVFRRDASVFVPLFGLNPALFQGICFAR
jgi:hypothetical protein